MTKQGIELEILKNIGLATVQTRILEIKNIGGCYHLDNEVFTETEINEIIKDRQQVNCLQIIEIRNYE
jgi:uncharacterized protein YerC